MSALIRSPYFIYSFPILIRRKDSIRLTGGDFLSLSVWLTSSLLTHHVCVNQQGGVLRGVHGEGEEDGKAVRHEVREEETEERPQSGERDRRVEEVKSSWAVSFHFWCLLSSQCGKDSHRSASCWCWKHVNSVVTEASSLKHFVISTESSTITSSGWRISMKVGPITISSCSCEFFQSLSNQLNEHISELKWDWRSKCSR